MIPAGLAAIVLVFFVGAAALFWIDQLEAVRAEKAYWRERDDRPEQYDWAEDPDL